MRNDDLFELVRELQQSEAPRREALYNQLFTALWSKAYYYCFRYLNNSHDAEDAAQEAFLILSKRIYELRAPEAFNSVFNMILSEVCIKNSKRSKKHGNVVELSHIENVEPDELIRGEDCVLEDMVLDKDLREQVVKIVDGLPEKQREAVMLYYFSELRQEEIAKVTDSNIGAVNRRLVVARKTIRESFEALVKKGNVDYSFAVLPVLTQLLQQDAEMLNFPDAIKSWNTVSQKLKAGGGGFEGKNPPAKANTAFLNTALAVLTTAAVVVGTVFCFQLYDRLNKPADDPPASQAAYQADEDIITALKRVATKADLDAFVLKYSFDDSATESYEDGMYTLYSKLVDDMRINVGLQEYSNSGIKITYEIADPTTGVPENIRTWFLAIEN